MSEKIELRRRGFLANILKGAAATVAAATVIEVSDDGKAKAVEDKNFDIGLPKNWPSFNGLIKKFKENPEKFTREDSVHLAMHMNMCQNAAKVLFVYSDLQKNQRILVWTHPLVVDKILYIVAVSEAFLKGQKICSRLTCVPHMDGKDRERFPEIFAEIA